MVASIGAVASSSQGASYYERDGYYAKDDPAHREASAWAGRGAGALGLSGPVDPDTFKAVLEGTVPDGSGRRLGRGGLHAEFVHRPGRDLTFSAPKSVSLAALVGGDARIVHAHDRAVKKSSQLVGEKRGRDPDEGSGQPDGWSGRADQKTVVATFRHDTSRNLDPLLHTHSVIANMLLGADGQWRTMANERLYRSKMLLGALYRSELAGELKELGYGIEKTHADGRFEIAGVSRETIEAFSTRDARRSRRRWKTGAWARRRTIQHLARRAALMTRAHKRDVDKAAPCEIPGTKQAADLGLDATSAGGAGDGKEPWGHGQGPGRRARNRSARARGTPARPVRMRCQPQTRCRAHPRCPDRDPAREAVDWALAHLSEREAVFRGADLVAASLAHNPGAAAVEAIEREVNELKRSGQLHEAPALEGGDGLATDKTVAEERETVSG